MKIIQFEPKIKTENYKLKKIHLDILKNSPNLLKVEGIANNFILSLTRLKSR